MDVRAVVLWLTLSCALPACAVEVMDPVAPTPNVTCELWWVHVPFLVMFPLTGRDVDVQNREVLREFVRYVSDGRFFVFRVEGNRDFCDGEEEAPDLDDARAAAVRSVVIELGIPADRVFAVGQDADRPRLRAACDARADIHYLVDNRRVEISAVRCRGDRHGDVRVAPEEVPLTIPRDPWRAELTADPAP